MSIQTTRTYVRKSIKCISSAFISCICSPSNSSKIITTTTTTTNWTVHSYSNRKNSISRHIFEYTQPKRVFKIICILRCVWLQKRSKKKLLHALKIKYNKKLQLWANNCARTWEKQAKKTYSSYTQWPKHRMQVHRKQQQIFLVFCAFIFLLFDDNANYVLSQKWKCKHNGFRKMSSQNPTKKYSIDGWMGFENICSKQNKLYKKQSHNDRGKMNRNEWHRS